MNQPLPMLFGAYDREWYQNIPKLHWYQYIMACRVASEVTITADELRIRKDELSKTLQKYRNDFDYPKLHPNGFLGIYLTEDGQYYLVVCNDIGSDAMQRIVHEILQKHKPGELAFSQLMDIEDRQAKSLQAYAEDAEREGRQLLYLASVCFGVTIDLSHKTTHSKQELIVYRQKVLYGPCRPEADPTILTRYNFPSHDTFHWFCTPVENLSNDPRVIMRDSMSKGLVVLDASQVSKNRQYIPVMTAMRGTFALRTGPNLVYSVLTTDDTVKPAVQLMSKLQLGGGKGSQSYTSAGSSTEPYVPDCETFIQENFNDLPLLFRLMPVAVIVNPAESQEVMNAASAYIGHYLR